MNLRILLCLLLISICSTIKAESEVWNLKSATLYCDSDMRHPLEGIWRSTSGEQTYFIVYEESLTNPTGCYRLFIIQDDEGFIPPGTDSGSFSATADATRFHARLGKGKLKREYAASISPDKNFISLEGDRIDFSFNPLAFVPQIRRMFSIRFRRPSKNLPKGFVRIYPRPAVNPVKL